MINEKGTVTEISDSVASVFVKREAECKGCASEKYCRSVGSGNSEVVVLAQNTLGAKLGDTVVVSISSSWFLKASAAIYILPIFGLLLGMLLGRFVTVSGYSMDEMSFFIGVFGLCFSLVLVKFINTRLEENPSLMPKITAIL